jgi:hypothetical protein
MSKRDKKPIVPNVNRQSNKPDVSKSFFSQHPKWSFKHWDNSHPKWGYAAQSEKTIASIISHLRTREFQTWGEICATMGKRNRENHFMAIDKLGSEPQHRLSEIHMTKHALLQDGELFSLHLMNAARLWGIIDDLSGVFHIIWYDPDHDVYPTHKLNT